MPKTRLCVAQLLPTLNTGGVERGTLEITEALTRAGHRALVVSAGGELVGEIEKCGGEHITLPVGAKSLSSFGLVSKLKQLLREEHVDIVHPRSRWPAWLAWFAWRSLPANQRPHFVTTVHGFYSVNAYSAIMTRGEKVICVSQSILNYVQSEYPSCAKERLVVIPRGIDRSFFNYGFKPSKDWLSKWQEEFPQLEAREILLLPGRITRLKGHHDFIKLVSRLTAAGRNIHGLILGGEDPNRQHYAKEVRKTVKQFGLEDRISFLGSRSDVREIMASSQIVLSLSTQPESFGRTTLEALSLGRPVIGYAHGGVDEILNLLYPIGCTAVGDIEALVNKALELLERPAPVRSENAFDLSQMQDKTLDLYQKLTR